MVMYCVGMYFFIFVELTPIETEENIPTLGCEFEKSKTT